MDRKHVYLIRFQIIMMLYGRGNGDINPTQSLELKDNNVKRQQWCWIASSWIDPHLNYFLKVDIQNIFAFILPTSTTLADLT